MELVHARARRRMSRGLKRKPMALIKRLRKAKKSEFCLLFHVVDLPCAGCWGWDDMAVCFIVPCCCWWFCRKEKRHRCLVCGGVSCIRGQAIDPALSVPHASITILWFSLRVQAPRRCCDKHVWGWRAGSEEDDGRPLKPRSRPLALRTEACTE